MKAAILVAVVLAGCMYPQKQFTEKRLVVGSKQTVQVEGLNISITNNGCGREWTNKSERPYCDIQVKTKDSTYTFGHTNSHLYIKNIELVIDKMNPWGREEDNIPPGGCRIIVKKLPDTSR